MILYICIVNKNNFSDTNQLLIERMKSVTDSVVQNIDVPSIVALVVDHKRGIDWLYIVEYSDIVNKLPMNGNYVFRRKYYQNNDRYCSPPIGG